jgi:hypothetical protein
MKKPNKAKPKPFYHRYIQLDKIYIQLKKVGLKPGEEKQTWDLVEEIVHTRFIDAVLEKVPAGKHEIFLERFSQNPEDEQLLELMGVNTEQIENHLNKTWEDLEKEITQDILGSLKEESENK